MTDTTLQTGESTRLASTELPPTTKSYLVVVAALTAFAILLSLLVSRGAGVAVPAEAVIAPLAAMAALVWLVWLVMLVVRNYAVLSKRITGTFYYTYRGQEPPDWVERPARTFNNLMQLPTLFYVACLLVLLTRRIDQAQLALAWTFVLLRAVHALVYIVWNHLPARFGTYLAGLMSVTVLWVRLIAQCWDLIVAS